MTMADDKPVDQYPEIACHKGKIEVTLPEWVNIAIFDRFGAKHSPAGRKRTFDRNLDSNEAEVRTYLGTYFPRSLAEDFVIFDSLLSDEKLAGTLRQEESISICSIGTGTGGDLLGLVLAIDKWIPEAKRINIVSIEGNMTAHEVMRSLFEAAQPRLHARLNLIAANYTFKAPRPFDRANEFLPAKPNAFNFVISSKMLNELDGAGISKRPYYEFCSAFASLLKPSGVLLILDVTSPNGTGGQWTPVVLNSQVNEFLTGNARYKTVLPLLCNRFEEGCDGCYTQNAIYVNYRNVTNECSKICYRVIGSAELADKLSGSVALWNCPITEDNRTHCQEFNRAD